MQARHCLSMLILALGASLSHAAWAHAEYRVTVVAPADSTATDINNSGVVIGNFPYSATSTHAFLNRGKGVVDLGTLRGTDSDAVAINDKGKILGHWLTSGGQRRGFLYHNGAARDIGVIPGRNTFYTDLNNAGYITAYGTVPDTFEGPHGFLRTPGGAFTDIGSLPFENPMTNANALNKDKVVVGASGPLVFPDQPLRAFVWAKGVMRDLGGFGMEPNAPLAINNCGQITGYASLAVGFRNRKAFLYQNGRMLDIDGRPDTEDRFSEGEGINNHGHIVGSSNHLSGFVYRGRRMQSLNTLVDPKLGWDIRFPRAINDAGQIAATAYRKGVQYAVRLDLIRPLALQVPMAALDEKTPSGEQADADAQEPVQPIEP